MGFGMKTILLMRHAKSSWDNAFLSDFERPLNSRGRRDAPRMGALLRAEDLTPTLIIASRAIRASQTAEEVAYASGYDGEIQFSRELYHADGETLVAALHGVDDRVDRVLLVAHNPGMSDLAASWNSDVDRMPTAAIAHFEWPVEQWTYVTEDGTADLVNLWFPRDLA